MFKSVEDLQQMSRTQLEATSQSAAALSRGFQQMVQEASDLSKKSMEDGSALLSNLIGAKSIEGAIQVQTDYAKSSYESYMAGARRMGELYASIFKDAYRPFQGVAEQARAVVQQ